MKKEFNFEGVLLLRDQSNDAYIIDKKLFFNREEPLQVYYLK